MAFAVPVFGAAYQPNQGQPFTALGAPCSAALSVGEHPEFLPEYLVWEQILGETLVSQSMVFMRLGLSSDLISEITVKAATAIDAARVKRGQNNSRIGDALAAREILSVRDWLERRLTPQENRELVALAFEAAQTKKMALPAIGTVKIVTPTSGYVCSVTIKGQEYPHLVPEAFYWEWLFSMYSRLASPYHRGNLEFDDYILRMLRSSWPISVDEISRFLQVSIDATTRAREIRESKGAEIDVARFTLDVRRSLIRTLPPSTWEVLESKAASLRDGMTVTFPPSPMSR